MTNTSGSNPFLDFIRNLLAFLFPQPPPPPLSMPRKVMAIVFQPTGPNFQSSSSSWSNPDDLVAGYIAKIGAVSGSQLTYQVTVKKVAPYFPALKDGRCYDDTTWAQAMANDTQAFRDPASGGYEMADYSRILADFNILQEVGTASVDEVWMFGGPLFGFYESCMVGKGAFWCNGPQIQAETRRFLVMGFNYERSVKEMVHDYGHRVENILATQFGSLALLGAMYSKNLPSNAPLPPATSFPAPKNDFEQFLLDHGTVHRAPGGLDYGQDEAAWLSALKPEWWPPTIDPDRVSASAASTDQ